MKKFSLLMLTGIAILATGCGGGTTHVYEEPAPREYVPYLEEFHIVDSYGDDTYDYTNPSPALNPDIDNGFFEIYWFVDSREDYIVNYRINNSPYIDDSLLINSDFCGEGLACDQDGLQFCQYIPDFYIACESNDSDVLYEVDIVDLIDTVPQTLYLFLEVCDTNSLYCEYDYYPVLME